MFAQLAMLLALAGGASEPCPPVPGAERLFASPARYVWIGEMHGTAEQPELFGDIVCLAGASGRKVVVALERSPGEQPAWDAYLSSEGGAAAKTAFLRSTGWTSQDGRGSMAMLALAERLRLARAEGRIEAVRLILPARPAADAAEHEQLMAEAVLAAGRERPQALVLILSGNLHASKADAAAGGTGYRLAASFLPSDITRSVFIVGGAGEAWNCQPNACGPHLLPSGPSRLARGVSFDQPPPGFDAMAFTGRPSTASPPAARSATPGR